MVVTASNGLLLEQRAAVSSSGPTIAPIVEIEPCSSLNSSLVKSLVENAMVNDVLSSERNGKDIVVVPNKIICQILNDVLPSKPGSVSPFAIYLVTGGICPPLTHILAKKKSLPLPATLPIHLLLKTAFSKPNTPCIIEPITPYYRAVLRRALSISGPGIVPGSSYSNSSSEWNNKDTSLPTDFLGSKESTVVVSELYDRFGTGVKLTRSCLTHTYSDVLRMSLGFAAGLRSLTFASDPINGLDTPYGGTNRRNQSESSDEESDSLKKDVSSSSRAQPVQSEERSGIMKASFGEVTYTPDRCLPLRVPVDASLCNPETSLPHTLYKQDDRCLGKVRADSNPCSSPNSGIEFKDSIGLLMSPGIESTLVSLGCPVVDVVLYQIDPFLHDPETMCQVFSQGHFGTIVVDDIGFELLARTHDVWRTTHQTTAWPIKIVITTSLFEHCYSPNMESIVSSLTRSVSLVDINEIIIKDIGSSLQRLSKFRANCPYSLSVACGNDPGIMMSYPRVLSVNFDARDGTAFSPLWSQQVMSSIAGALVLERPLGWAIDKHDVVMLSRIETPVGEALEDALNLETAASYQLSLMSLYCDGKIALVPLTRLFLHCHTAQDTIKALKPTIAVGTTSTWAVFTKRLSHESGIDGATTKGWKDKMMQKRCCANEHSYDKSKQVVKDLFFRKVVDPVAFRHGRQLLGSHIRLAVVIDPVDGTSVMHQSSMSTLKMLISSRRDMKVVQIYSTSCLGGQPLAMISGSHIQSNPQAPIPPTPEIPSTIACHTGDATYNDRCTYDRRITLGKLSLPKELVDASISAPSVAPCLVNGSLDFMLSGVDESSYPLSSPKHESGTPDRSDDIECRVARGLRLSSIAEIPLTSDCETKAFVSGSFAQMQDRLLGGALYVRLCIDSKMRQKFRYEAISNFLVVHCFHILNVISLNKITSDAHHKNPLISSTQRSQYIYDGGSLIKVCLDVDVEINPLSIDHGSKEAQERSAALVRDSLCQGMDLQVNLSGSVLSHFAKLWPQGILPNKYVDTENLMLDTTMDAATRDVIDSVLKKLGSNLVVDQCRTVTQGLIA